MFDKTSVDNGVDGASAIILAKLFGIFDQKKDANTRSQELTELNLSKEMVDSKIKELELEIKTLKEEHTNLTNGTNEKEALVREANECANAHNNRHEVVVEEDNESRPNTVNTRNTRDTHNPASCTEQCISRLLQ